MDDQNKTPEPIEVPFFARFLEDQELDEVVGGGTGSGRPKVTLKWPSDGDELPTI